ncbi:MAG: sporulation protein YtfJ [Oscillibacter sp.]|nr:sporulation protein YtfJ [Oscillibacter sp.]
MEKNNPINDMLQESMAKLRELADTNTIVGQPITTPDGVTLIPISRVSLGVGGGGSIFGKKKDANPEGNLGAGMGAGVTIAPVAFLIVKDGFTRMMPVAAPPMNTVDRVVEMAPDVIDKVTGFIEKQQDKKKAKAEAAEEER